MKTLTPPPITPGPWKARPLEEPQWGIHGESEWELVANTLHGNDRVNATFISAAPAMAEALLSIWEHFAAIDDLSRAEEREFGKVEKALLSAGYTLKD